MFNDISKFDKTRIAGRLLCDCKLVVIEVVTQNSTLAETVEIRLYGLHRCAQEVVSALCKQPSYNLFFSCSCSFGLRFVYTTVRFVH